MEVGLVGVGAEPPPRWPENFRTFATDFFRKFIFGRLDAFGRYTHVSVNFLRKFGKFNRPREFLAILET